jgi:3-methyladenine DNA glycosylase AlkC
MEPFKAFVSADVVRRLGQHIARVLPGFDRAGFEAEAVAGLETRELMARAGFVADRLHPRLPVMPAERAEVLLAILHPDPLDHANRPSDDEGICGWGVLPLTLLVGRYGLADFDRSLELLREMTKRFTSEFGIRPFLLADQDRALARLAGWLDDPNRHVRRLICEGTRPRLPWATRLPALMRDPAPVLPLLLRLRDDREAAVRKSVANHLNDIGKDHPALLVDLAADWMRGAGPERRQLLSHALRTLVKRGDPAALAVLGRGPARIETGALEVTPDRVAMGGEVEMRLAIRSTARAAQELTVDYVVHFRKANGSLAPKVFKGAVLTLAPGGEVVFRRRHRFREVTTRRHYPGTHAISLRINGADTAPVPFELA